MANDLWQTPDYVYQWLDNIFHFNMDAAADEHNKKTPFCFTEKCDALKWSWTGCFNVLLKGKCLGEKAQIFCNPPYSRNKHRSLWDWCKKFYEEGQAGALVVALLPLDATAWVRDWVIGKAEVWIPDERIAFIDPATGKPGENPTRGAMIAIYGPEARVGHVRFVHIPREEGVG